MDIRFYDYEHGLIAIVAHKQSVNWMIYYNDIGTFELHISMKEPQAKSILEHDYLTAVQGKYAAIIVEKQISGSDLGIYGRTCNWLLSRRVALPFEEKTEDVTKTAESLCPDYMTFQNDCAGGAEQTFEATAPEPVSDLIKTLFDESNLGHEVLFSRGGDGGTEWIFRIYEGEEKNILISEAARTASELTYDDSLIEYYSCGYYCQEHTDKDGSTLESTWEEVVKDEAEGVYRSEAILDAESAANAQTELAAKSWIRNAEGKIRRLKFGKDYNLGDIVSVQMERGDFRRTTRCRVTGVHIWEEENESGEEPVMEAVV